MRKIIILLTLIFMTFNLQAVDCDSSKVEWDGEHPTQQKLGLNIEDDKQYQYYSDGNTFYFNCYDSYPCNYMIEIFDPVGRRVFDYKGVTSSAKNAIDIRKRVVEKGVYLYKVSVNGTIIGTGKIIK